MAAVESTAPQATNTLVTPKGPNRSQAIRQAAALCERAGVHVGPRRLHKLVRRWESTTEPLGLYLARVLGIADRSALRGADPTGDSAARNVDREREATPHA